MRFAMHGLAWTALLTRVALGADLSSVFSDDMVLQAAPARATVFGSVDASDGAIVVELVCMEGGGVVGRTVATIDTGTKTWRAQLEPIQAGGLYKVTLKSLPNNATVSPTGGPFEQESATLERVTFGNVWMCSGQSNMSLKTIHTYNHENVRKELATGTYDKLIRMLDYSGQDTSTLQSDTPVFVRPRRNTPVWHNASGLAASQPQFDDFSSTCLYFGLQMQKRFQAQGLAAVPLGLVHASQGGSVIEAWVDASTLHSWNSSKVCNCLQAPNPSRLFNGLVAPFLNVSITGWVWYQGENNVGYDPTMKGYGCELEAMIRLWRALWSSGTSTSPEAPFGIVTLAGGGDEGFPENMASLRASQVAVAHKLPSVFIAHAYDLADPWGEGDRACLVKGCCPSFNTTLSKDSIGKDCLPWQDWWQSALDGPWLTGPLATSTGAIHPRNKLRLGDRLAIGAIATHYSSNTTTHVNPRVQSARVVDGALRFVFSIPPSSGGLVALNESQWTTGSRALEVCTGTSTQCSCRYRMYRRQPDDSTAWYCADATGAESSRPGTAVSSNWRPTPDPLASLWHPLRTWRVERLSASLAALWVSLPPPPAASPSAVRFAWSSQPCCDDARYAQGTAPCPPMNCALRAAITDMPVDPFFFTLDNSSMESSESF